MLRGVACGAIALIALACGLVAVGVRAQSGPITLEARTATSLTVSWNWTGQTAAAFELAWRARGDDASTAWSSVRKTAAQRRHTISELDAGTHYIVRVRALNAAGRPLADLRSVFATSWSAPQRLRVTARADTALTLSWAPPTDWTPHGYRLRWRVAGAETGRGDLALPATADSRQISGLTTGAAYAIRLTALNARGGESPPQTLTATAAGEPPAAPRLTDFSWSGLTIRVEWASVPRATGYNLRWSSAGEQASFSPEQEVDASPAEFDAPRAGRYQVEVRARIGSGPTAVYGDWSRPVDIKLLPAPDYLRALSFDGERVRLSWPGVGASRYALEWGERGGTVQTATRDGRSGILDIGPLDGGKTYEFRVRARDSRGWSEFSPTATVTTTTWTGRLLAASYDPADGQIEVIWPAAAGAEWYELGWINAADNAETARIRVPAAAPGTANVSAEIGREGGFENGVWAVRVRAGPWGVWSAPGRITLANQPPRLALELTSSRELCTAGTPTEISWEIAGGTPPYTLSVEGSAVDVAADNVRVICGARAEPPAADTDTDAALEPKRVTAAVTDSRGIQRQASLDVARARALPPLLPAPDRGEAVSAYRSALGFEWHAPSTLQGCRQANCFAIRWRAVSTEAWTYAPMTHAPDGRNLTFSLVQGLADGVAYEAAGAAMRHPLELETPEALRWTVPIEGTTLTNPTGLTATATHDTVTVRWNRQPSARFWSVLLSGPDGSLGEDVASWDAASWGDPATAVHEVVFRHLPSATRYEVLVQWSGMEGYATPSAETSVETLALPAGREPLQRGAQNLRATATHDSITVAWDQPFAQARDRYWVYLFDPDYYRARRVTVWHPNTQFTFTGLKSGVTYRIEVLHMAIVRASAEISVTTTAPPNGDSAGGATPGQRQQSATDEWPLSGTFQPVWPHTLRTAANEWSILTDDAWIARSNRWHGGIDTGLSPRNGSRQQIQAVAEGILREYDPQQQGFVLFCPGSSTSSNLVDQVQVSRKGNTNFGEGINEVKCTELANRYHGRVAFTFHEYGDTFYAVQYAHLSAFGTASEPRLQPSLQPRRVAAGAPIGIEGGTGVNDETKMWSATAYLPHLHMTIRVFTQLGADDEVAKTTGGKWRELDAETNWHCGDVQIAPSYCDHLKRAIETMVDPEEVLPPTPPAVNETGPGRGIPTWNSATHADQTHNVNNNHKRFVLRSVDLGADGQVDVDLDIAVWRPHFYTYPYWENMPPNRFLASGRAATRDGVQGYFASAGNCGHIVQSDADDKIAFTNAASGHVFWSEVEPMRLTVTLRQGRDTCDVSVGSYNDSHDAGASIVTGAYGRDSAGRPFAPERPTARVSKHGTVLDPSESAVTLANESLAKFEFRIYEFEATIGYTYQFQTVLGQSDDVALEWWQGGQSLASASDGPGSVTLTWTATESGTAHIVARNGIGTNRTDPNYGLPWTGSYGLRYSKTPPPRCKLGDDGRPVTTLCTPATPTINANVKRASDSITFKWNAASVPVEYQVRLTKGTTVGNATSPNNYDGTRSHRFTGLDPNTAYKVEVKAINKIAGTTIAESGWASYSGYTLLPTPTVRSVTNITHIGAKLNWYKVTAANGYQVKRSEGSGETTTTTISGMTSTSHPFPGLSPSTRYTFYVRATLSTNSAVTSKWAKVTRTTDPQPTSPPPLDPDPDTDPIDCLASTRAAQWTAYSGVGCRSVLASVLLADVTERNAAVCGLGLWRAGVWFSYGMTPSGRIIPGSRPFDIHAGDDVWLTPCGSVGLADASLSGADGAMGGDFLEE